MNRGNFPDAVRDFEAARRLKEKDWTAHYYLGIACARNKEYRKAIESLETALEHAPRSQHKKLIALIGDVEERRDRGD